MNKQQWMLIIGSVAMILILYFGFDTKPPKQRLIEKSRAGDVELQELQNEIRAAKASLPEDQRKYIQGIEHVLEGAEDDTLKSEALRTLSGTWYELGAYLPAGYYAEQLAESVQTAESWGIAGSTYGAALTQKRTEDQSRLASSSAVRCFENAISLDPDHIDYRINLAIIYAEVPPAENPMKGIQSLLDLNRQYPENTSVLYHLARFGMRTGQYEKAKERLEKALSLAPDENRLNCLMAELLKETGEQTQVEQFQKKCNSQ